MQISTKKVYDFHHKRTQAHIDCLNYFAELLGYHFPEHDNDKNSGTICNGYAYHNYAKYHPECNITPAHKDLFKFARHEHHNTQPHHLEYYSNVCEIPNIILVEMVCDWHSASFEQRYLTHEYPKDYTVRDWFFTHMLHAHPFTSHQLGLINNLIDFLDMYSNHDEVLKIWLPLLEI